MMARVLASANKTRPPGFPEARNFKHLGLLIVATKPILRMRRQRRVFDLAVYGFLGLTVATGLNAILCRQFEREPVIPNAFSFAFLLLGLLCQQRYLHLQRVEHAIFKELA